MPGEREVVDGVVVGRLEEGTLEGFCHQHLVYVAVVCAHKVLGMSGWVKGWVDEWVSGG